MEKDLLIITRVNKNIEVLPYILNSINEAKKVCNEVSFTWYVVFNLESIEYIPSKILKILGQNCIINYSRSDWKNVLTEVFLDAIKIHNYKYIYVLEEQNSIPNDFFQKSKELIKANLLPIIVFKQFREDGNVYPKSWKSTIKTSVGVLDFGQILFQKKALEGVFFDTSEVSSGKTVDNILARYLNRTYVLQDQGPITTRRGLQVPSTSSKPKVLAPHVNQLLNSNELEVMLQNEANYGLCSKYGVRLQFTGDATRQYNNMMDQIIRFSNSYPLVSLFTSAYNIGDRILQTWETVKNQTYKYWEWVIVNDSCDGGNTSEILNQISKEDERVKVYQFTERSKGNIGEAKFRAAGLTHGQLLAELDHDDLLHPRALEYIVDAADAYPQAGFFYSDCVEVDQKYNCPLYPEGFALGYGSYRKEEYIGINWDTQNTVPTNPLTIRHIVGVPNHIRVWRQEVYHAIGGYNNWMRIADDYELIVRTFLVTRFCRVAKNLYFQRFDGNNSQDNGNRADIQLKVREIAKFYREKIKARFDELGIEDFVDEQLDNVPFMWYIPPRGKEYDVNYTYTPKE